MWGVYYSTITGKWFSVTPYITLSKLAFLAVLCSEIDPRSGDSSPSSKAYLWDPLMVLVSMWNERLWSSPIKSSLGEAFGGIELRFSNGIPSLRETAWGPAVGLGTIEILGETWELSTENSSFTSSFTGSMLCPKSLRVVPLGVMTI